MARPIGTEAEHDRQVLLYQTGRRLLKKIDVDYEPAEARLKEIGAWVKGLKGEEIALVKPHVGALDAGITAYRRRVEDEARETARKAAEVEQARLKAEQDKEAARIEAEAKKLRGADRKDALQEAERVRDAPLPSVESAVSRAMQRSTAAFTGAGAAPTSTYWSAAVESVGALLAHIVASDEGLYQAATELRAARKRGEGFQAAPVEAAIGLARVKGELTASTWLNQQAKALEKNLNISGVRAVSRDSLRNV